MPDEEYTHHITYYSDNDRDYTEHLVKEMDDFHATTACGLELNRAENRDFTRPPIGYTGGLPVQTADRNKCGNCPWDEVEDGS